MAISKRTSDYVKSDLDHVIHPVGIVGEESAVVFAGGHGIMLRDTEGREYIDGTAGAANVNVGHGRTEIAEAAMAQMKDLAFSVIFRNLSHTAVVDCAEKLAELTPEGLSRFFFCSGGSEAVETALKFTRFYWRNQGTHKFKVIGLYEGYHGTTFGAISAGAMSKGRNSMGFEPLVPGFLHIPRYYCYRCGFGLSYPECQTHCARYLEEVIKSEGPDSVAAFIAEPVQGGGGMVPPPPEYWPIVREICTRYNVLLIADEVITGFGRTGRLFALEHGGVKPDIMTMAKGITSGYLPLGAVAVTDEIHQGLKTPGSPLPHLLTYSGHPACCAAGVKNMEILVEEGMTENAARVGEYLQNQARGLGELPLVGDVSGLGLMCGIELVADKATKKPLDQPAKVQQKVLVRCREKGLLLRTFGDRIGISPPLPITTGEVDRLIDILGPVLAGLEAE